MLFSVIKKTSMEVFGRAMYFPSDRCCALEIIQISSNVVQDLAYDRIPNKLFTKAIHFSSPSQLLLFFSELFLPRLHPIWTSKALLILFQSNNPLLYFSNSASNNRQNNCCGNEKNWEFLLIDDEKALSFLIQKKSNELFKIQKLWKI